MHFDFQTRKFQLDEISDAVFQDSGDWCNNVVERTDRWYGKVLALKTKYGTSTLLEGGDVHKLVACGESLDKPLTSGKYYLIEAIAAYDKSGKNNILDALLDYKIKTDVKDKYGNSAYAVALLRGIEDKKILDRLRQGLRPSEILKAQRTVTLLLNGSDLSLEQMDNIIHDGDNSVPVNSNISVYTSGLMYKEKEGTWTGTALGNAIVANDIPKTKWLLDNGADPNMFMGEYEFKVSPLRYALSLQKDDLSLAEQLLKHGANGDEVFPTMPGQVSLNAYFRDNPEITALLSKHGFNKWYLEDPENNLQLTTKDDIVKLKTP